MSSHHKTASPFCLYYCKHQTNFIISHYLSWSIIYYEVYFLNSFICVFIVLLWRLKIMLQYIYSDSSSFNTCQYLCIGILTFYKYWHPSFDSNICFSITILWNMKQNQHQYNSATHSLIYTQINRHIYFRYNMEKFAGQPIDTLADSRR